MAKCELVVARPFKNTARKNWNAARRRRYANSCSQDLEALLEHLVPVAHLPVGYPTAPSTLCTFWNITRDHRARLVWTNRDFFRTLQFTYIITFLKFLICIHAGNPRVPPPVLASGPKPCGGKYLVHYNSPKFRTKRQTDKYTTTAVRPLSLLHCTCSLLVRSVPT